MEKLPQGVRFEPTPDGFRLRASCLSFTDTIMRVGLAGCLSVLPFKLWWDLIRNYWTYEGFNFWATTVFLGVWAAAIGYADWIALVSLFGEIRITKAGRLGEIFTGIGKLGRTRRIAWDDFDGVCKIESQSESNGHTSTTRYVALDSQTKRLKFGWQLPEDRRLFVVAALRDYAFGAGAAKPQYSD
jgi:hypothetical protein